MLALAIGKIRHLRNMMIPNYPTKSGQIRITHKNNAAAVPTPNELTLFRLEPFFTKYAISHGKNVNENST
jgi:hypothetical protein